MFISQPRAPLRMKKKSLLPTQQPSSSRASVVFPIAPCITTYSPQHQYSQRTATNSGDKNSCG